MLLYPAHVFRGVQVLVPLGGGGWTPGEERPGQTRLWAELWSHQAVSTVAAHPHSRPPAGGSRPLPVVASTCRCPQPSRWLSSALSWRPASFWELECQVQPSRLDAGPSSETVRI